MNTRELLDEAIFNFVEEHLGLEAAIDYDYSNINDELDEIDGSK